MSLSHQVNQLYNTHICGHTRGRMLKLNNINRYTGLFNWFTASNSNVESLVG